MTLSYILFALILNIVYFVISQKIRISKFFYYFIGFIIFTIIIFFILFFLKLNFFFKEIIPFFFIYSLFFISLFLTMSVKYIRSPSYIIFKSLKKPRKKDEIIKYLENHKVIKKRLVDLEDQKIIEIKNNKIYLKKNLNLILNLIFKIKIFFNLKSEG